MVTIVTWHPDTCRCVVDYKVNDIIEFYCIQKVCDNHKHLASTEFRADHENLNRKSKDILNSILDNNIKSHNDRKEEFDDEDDFRQNLITIQNHNTKCRNRYEKILSRPHAFDAHIYDIILTENRMKNNG